MQEFINNNILSSIIGALLGSFLAYFFSMRSLAIQTRKQLETKLYMELFEKIRDCNSTIHELKNLKCNAQIFASDKIIDFLDEIDFDTPFSKKKAWELLVLIRNELGLKPRDLYIYIHNITVRDKNER